MPPLGCYRVATGVACLCEHARVIGQNRIDERPRASKPLLKLKPNLTLIDYQIQWLQKHGFRRIILASREESLTKSDVEYSLEKEKLGTGGALKKRARAITCSRLGT